MRMSRGNNNQSDQGVGGLRAAKGLLPIETGDEVRLAAGEERATVFPCAPPVPIPAQTSDLSDAPVHSMHGGRRVRAATVAFTAFRRCSSLTPMSRTQRTRVASVLTSAVGLGALLLVLAVVLLATSAVAAGDDVSSRSRRRFPSAADLFASMPTYGSGGGLKCAGCTGGVALLSNLAEYRQEPIERVLDEFCDILPAELQSTCDELVAKYGPAIIEYISQKESPDRVCQLMGICTNATCRAFPDRYPAHVEQSSVNGQRERPAGHIHAVPLESLRPDSAQPPRESPWDWIKKLLERVANHYPAEDIDQDHFSTVPTLRGSSWRGKDCNDLMANVYPGRNDATGLSANVDHNCNGIFGVDPQGRPYEDRLCANTGARGIVVLGDSAAAHFHVPPEWLNASLIHPGVYDNLLFALENELDWPQLSSATGYVNSTVDVPVDSTYLHLRARNLCNHRDYQNIAVNGARSSAMASSIMQTMARNRTTDKPLLVVYSLVGNDVCDWEHDLDHMTTPAEFQKNVLTTLNYLDATVPPGSHVVFIGLADGRVLYDTMHNRTHPIGNTYKDLYDYMNCLEISPCWVWLNSDESVRNAGSQRAAELSAVYNQIIAQYKFTNFDMAYYDFPFQEVIQRWQAQGGQVWQLIEPVDGFHPNQISQYLSASVLWEKIVAEHPDFVGPVNPNNALIQALFGDQGGH